MVQFNHLRHRPAVAAFGRSLDGGVALIFGLTLLPIALGVGAAVDYGRLSSAKAVLQRSADSAALSGARTLATSEGQPEATRISAVTATVRLVVGAESPGAASVVTPTLSSNQVAVQLTSPIRLMFGGLLGRQGSDVAAAATATYARSAAPCFVALGASEAVGIEMVGSPRISAPRCGVVSNAAGTESLRLQGAAEITAASICATGSARGAEGKTRPAASSACKAASDPYGNVFPPPRSRCDYTNANYGATTKAVVLNPGVYCGGLSIAGTAVTLSPGLYEFQNGPLSIQGSGSLFGNGVSLLLRGVGATLQIQGNPQVTLSATTTGPLAGIAIAAVPTSPAETSILQGSPNVTLKGSLYLPGQKLTLQGSPTLTTLGSSDRLVALSFELHGSPDVSLRSDDTSSSGGSEVSLRLSQ